MSIKSFSFLFAVVIILSSCQTTQSENLATRNSQLATQTVSSLPGLIAFWDFEKSKDGTWTAYNDPNVVTNDYPVYLRHTGSDERYRFDAWPYTDKQSALVFDTTGPFGHAVKFNRGYIYAEVPRNVLDSTPLDISGRRPFTMTAWVRFDGARHLICGIWDEGGWSKYSGRRQYALFGGLFGSSSVIGHVSTTGAASYPQSNADGSQFARMRAIDGQPIPNGKWVAVSMTFDPDSSLLKMYVNGKLTQTSIVDPVENSVYHFPEKISSNPMKFDWPIWSPRAFTIKYNGYSYKTHGVYEMYIDVNLNTKRLSFGAIDKLRVASCELREILNHGTHGFTRNYTEKQLRVIPCSSVNSVVNKCDVSPLASSYRVRFDITRNGKSLLTAPIVADADKLTDFPIPIQGELQVGDVIETSLEMKSEAGTQDESSLATRNSQLATSQYTIVGKPIQYPLVEGAPFTFCRALGLGKGEPSHGGQITIDGVAVFNRVLSEEELKAISFCEQ